jgi:hypothetical protein
MPPGRRSYSGRSCSAHATSNAAVAANTEVNEHHASLPVGEVHERGSRSIIASADGRAVLGVDLASKRWSDVGTALLTFAQDAPRAWRRAVPRAVPWPAGSALTPTALADVIDEFARENNVTAVSLDGPQGWRHPGAHPTQGVGRACERSAHTPGKTGTYGRTYPSNQVGWISFSIDVFDRLLQRTSVHLVNGPGTLPQAAPPSGEYFLLECFPTVTWRSSGLAPPPAKSKRPNTATFASGLARRWASHPSSLHSATTTSKRSSQRCRRLRCSEPEVPFPMAFPPGCSQPNSAYLSTASRGSFGMRAHD